MELRYGFNPLPSQKQGETHLRCADGHGRGVSIRSPHKSKGRLNVRLPPSACFEFQSAPLTKARGDRCPLEYGFYGPCFNPLPSQKQGETGSSTTLMMPVACFNPLPSQKQGETQHQGRERSQSPVSIRSPHKSKGRRDRHRACARSDPFQSAPLTKARGDAMCRRPCPSATSFQSAPLTKARGDAYPHGLRAGGCRFNPLPSQKQGETHSARRVRLPDGPVSIRSPHKSKGRPNRLCLAVILVRFQSAPLTKARGDAGCCNQRNDKRLHTWMREPPFLGILRPKREHVPRCKLLLARNLLTARKQAQNAVTLHSRTL